MTKKIVVIFSLIIILLSASIIGCTKDTGTKTPVTGDGTPVSTPTIIFAPATATPMYTGDGTPVTDHTMNTLPTPPCITGEEWRRIAFKYISERDGIPQEKLYTQGSTAFNYTLTGVRLRRGKIVVKPEMIQGWVIAVNCQGDIIDYKAAEQAEQKAYKEKYGNLEPRLYDLLQAAGPDDVFKVSIMVRRDDNKIEEVRRDVAAKYPELHLDKDNYTTTKDTPRDLYENVFLPEVRAEEAKIEAILKKPIEDYLRGLGYEYVTEKRSYGIVTTIPKKIILNIATRDDAGNISAIEEGRPALDSAGSSQSAPTAWQQEINGSNVKIG